MQRRQGIVICGSGGGGGSGSGLLLRLLLLPEPPLLGREPRLFLRPLGLLGRLRRPGQVGLVPGGEERLSSRDVLLSQEDVTGSFFFFFLDRGR